jgi:DtxR family Mn-dependent transcriptional regulator
MLGTHSTRSITREHGILGRRPGGPPRRDASDYHRSVHRHHDDPHAVSEAAQVYLLTLRSMEGGGTRPMTASLARRMHLSVQAASEMVGRLASDGLVEVGPDRTLAMTAAGWRAADTIFHRHALMEWLLTRVIGLGWAESDEEAMRLQGAISPRVEQAIDDLLGHPQTCPHGNPMDSDTARRRPTGIPLSEAVPGSTVTILRITEEAEEDAELLVYLEQQGLIPGVIAQVTEISRARDSITFVGPRGEGSMGLRPASLIRVLPGPADPGLFHRVPDAIAGLQD